MKKRIALSLFCLLFLLAGCATVNRSAQLPEELDQAVSNALLEENQNDFRRAECKIETHTLIGCTEESGVTTVGLMVTLRGYQPKAGGGYLLVANRTQPVLLTFTQQGGHYTKTGYWEAPVGADQEAAVKEAFPTQWQEDACDMEAYQEPQQNICNAKADAYFATRPTDPALQ